MRYTLAENVIIKQTVPERGIVCSNPARAARVSERLLSERTTLCEDWGVRVECGCCADGTALFVAAVPMGAGGSGFAFLELFAAGARAILRYGSSDRRIEAAQLRDILLIDRADNLVGLMRDAGLPAETWGTEILASPALVAAIESAADERSLRVHRRLCHHLEDYHAANFPECADRAAVLARMPWLLDDDPGWNSDMESAALFFRARQCDGHAASVLQPLLKQRGQTSPYSGDHAAISLAMEAVIIDLVGAALQRVAL